MEYLYAQPLENLAETRILVQRRVSDWATEKHILTTSQREVVEISLG